MPHIVRNAKDLAKSNVLTVMEAARLTTMNRIVLVDDYELESLRGLEPEGTLVEPEGKLIT